MREGVRSLANMPARVAALAGVTFTQLIRMRLFLVPAVFGVGFMALQFLPYHGQLGVETRGVQQLQLIKDVAMGCMQLFGLIFCVGATALLIPRDAEDRILYTILCKPVPRFEYLLGKLLGVWLVLLLMLLLMDAMMVGVLYFREASLCTQYTEVMAAKGLSPQAIEQQITFVQQAGNSWNTQRAVLAMFMGFGVLTGLTLLFSCFTSGTIVSMIFALGAYFLGMFQHQLVAGLQAGVSGAGSGDAAAYSEQILRVVLPDFNIFNVADTATAGVPLTWGMLGTLALIAAGYMLLHLLVATYIFSRKEF